MIATEASASRIRVATRSDEAALISLCKLEHEEFGSGDFSLERVQTVMRRAFDPGVNDPVVIGIAGIIYVDGSIGIEVTSPWNADSPYLNVLWSYTVPAARKSTVAKDLVAFAKRLTCPPPIGVGLQIRWNSVVNPRTEAYVRMLKRHVGEPVAYAWIYEDEANAGAA